MGHNTFAIIALDGNALTSEFFGVLSEAFRRHGYEPKEICTLAHNNPDWNERVNWSEVGGKISGEQGMLWAMLMQKPDVLNQFILSYAGGLRCVDLQINSCIFLPQGRFYEMQDKEHASALQALCLDLHERLGAIDTIATNEDELVLFHFAKEEWKLMDFPMDMRRGRDAFRWGDV